MFKWVCGERISVCKCLACVSVNIGVLELGTGMLETVHMVGVLLRRSFRLAKLVGVRI